MVHPEGRIDCGCDQECVIIRGRGYSMISAWDPLLRRTVGDPPEMLSWLEVTLKVLCLIPRRLHLAFHDPS